MITLYDPAGQGQGPPALGPAAAAAAPAAAAVAAAAAAAALPLVLGAGGAPPTGGINTVRPDGGAAAPPTTATPALPPSASAASSAQTTPTKRPLLHDELSVLLPPAVFTALDATTGMEGSKRVKFQDQCRKSLQYLDNTIAAPLHHLTSLSLAEGAHFDPVKRGFAMAGAGRSAAAPTSSVAHFADSVARDTYTKSLITIWKEMRPAFSAPHELSSTNVDLLWSGVTFVLSHRAARSAD